MNTTAEHAALTDAEARAVIDRLRGPFRRMASLMYGTGLRFSEIVELRVKDVEVRAGRIYVRRTNGGRDRVAELPAELAAELAEQIESGRARHEADLKAGLGALLPPEVERALPLAATRWCWQFVFAGPRIVAHPVTGQPVRAPVSGRAFLEALQAAADRAGLDRTLHSHDLRHAFAARLAERGAPLQEIQIRMGHEDLRVTAAYARRLEAQRTAATALAVDRAWIVHYAPVPAKGLFARLRQALAGGAAA